MPRFPKLPHRVRRKFRAAVAAVLIAVLFWAIMVALIPYRRELQRNVPHLTPAADPQFARDMAGLYGSPIIGGNKIETLRNGDAIFSAMLHEIRQAERSITFETYIYWSGDIAGAFCDALVERAQAGVRVKVLIDWMGGLPMEDDLIDRMHDGGVMLRMFRPMRPRTLTRMNNRTHRKVLVIDGRIGFTGGVGIADTWRGDARNSDEWRDTHYRVTGPVVAMLQNAFAHNWVEASGEVLRGSDFYPPLEAAGGLDVQMIKSNTGSRNEVHLMLMTALAAATQSIRISTPYFVPDRVAIDQLLAARRRGVEVTLLVAGEHTDSRMVRHVSRRCWAELLRAGVRLLEFQPTFLHAKLIIIDEVWTSIGSANFDERSFRLNDEANLNIYARGFAQEQAAIFEDDCARARPVTLADLRRLGWWAQLQAVVLSVLRPHL